MPTVTSWTRLEPRARNAGMADSLQARVRDPLWMLARQWQFGEFQGEDAGTPIRADLSVEQCLLAYYRLGPPGPPPAPGTAYDRKTPLEAIVEGEATTGMGRTSRRIAVEAGLDFWRVAGAALAGRFRPAYLERFAVRLGEAERGTLDPVSLRFLQLMEGRALDGAMLYDELRGLLGPALQGTLPAELGGAEMQPVARAWLLASAPLFTRSRPAHPPAGVPERLEYELAVAASDSQGRELTMVAVEYPGGRLDWPSFAMAPANTAPLHAVGQAQRESHSVIPKLLQFAGMPAARYWEFEEAQINFGAVEVAAEDLARLVLLEFTLVCGNNYFIIPIELPIGSLSFIHDVTVTDSFGIPTMIPSAASLAPGGQWQIFTLTGDQRGGLLLPPVPGPSIHSAVLEEVHFLRDEMANLAWAVERIVQSPAGKPLNRLEAYLAARRRRDEASPPPAPADQPPVYRLATPVPDPWIPLVPQQVAGEGLRLRAGLLLDLDDVRPPAPPQSHVLQPGSPGRPFSLYDEEVPRAGVLVSRSYQYVRWHDGSTHLWLARRKLPGRGEGSSGLRYDAVEPTTEPK